MVGGASLWCPSQGRWLPSLLPSHAEGTVTRGEPGWSEIRTPWGYGKTSSKPSCTCKSYLAKYWVLGLFPPPIFLGKLAGTQAWWHVPLTGEPSCRPFINFWCFETGYRLDSFSCPRLPLPPSAFLFFNFTCLSACARRGRRISRHWVREMGAGN